MRALHIMIGQSHIATSSLPFAEHSLFFSFGHDNDLLMHLANPEKN
jgi:hypothetical protein